MILSGIWVDIDVDQILFSVSIKIIIFKKSTHQYDVLLFKYLLKLNFLYILEIILVLRELMIGSCISHWYCM